MESKYVRLGQEQVIFGKKELLSAEIGLLETVKKIRNYRILRKKESALKNNFGSCFRDLKMKIGFLQSTLPEQNQKPLKIEERKESKNETKQNRDIQEQLEEIKSKLAKLG